MPVPLCECFTQTARPQDGAETFHLPDLPLSVSLTTALRHRSPWRPSGLFPAHSQAVQRPATSSIPDLSVSLTARLEKMFEATPAGDIRRGG